MPIQSPEEWLAAQQGGDTAVASAPVEYKKKPPTSTSGVQSPDEWLAQQIKSGDVTPPGHPSHDNLTVAQKKVSLANPLPTNVAQMTLSNIGQDVKQGLTTAPDFQFLHSKPTDSTVQAFGKGVGTSVEGMATAGNVMLGTALGPVIGAVAKAYPAIAPIISKVIAGAFGAQMVGDAATKAGTASGMNPGPAKTQAYGEATGSGTLGFLGAGTAAWPAKFDMGKAPPPPQEVSGPAKVVEQYAPPKAEAPAGHVILPSPLVDQALREAQSGILPSESAKTGGALGQMWRESVSKSKLGGLVKPANEVEATAKPTEEGGKVSFMAKAGPGEVPSGRQLEAKPVVKAGEQASKMEGSFVPQDKERGVARSFPRSFNQGPPYPNTKNKYLTGVVDANDSVRATEHEVDKAGNSHKQFGYNDYSGRWRYIPRWNRVDWTDTPTESKMDAVDNYLAKRDIQPDSHQAFSDAITYRESDGPSIARSPSSPEHHSLVSSLRPAVRLSDGTIHVGQLGDIHNDIIKREASNGNAKPLMEDLKQTATRGFVKVGDEGKLISREDAQKMLGEKEPLNSERLNELQGGVARLPITGGHPESVSFEHQVLGLDKPSQPTLDIAKNIAREPDFYGKEESGLMRYLVDCHGNALAKSTTLLDETDGYSGVLYNVRTQAIQGMRQSTDPLADFMHEATHAATYDALEAPKTHEQRQAVDQIDSLRKQVIAQLPENVRKFLISKYTVALAKSSEEHGLPNEDTMKLFTDNHIDPAWIRRLYQLQDNHEYLAGVFDDASFRQHLNSFTPTEGEGGFVKQTWSAIKDLLGIKKGTALDRTFDALNELHDPLDVKRGSDFPPAPPESGEIGKVQRLPPNAIVVAQNFFANNRPNKGWREEWEANLGYMSGKTVPRTMAADKDVGEALVKYGSSSISGPAWGKALASSVLESHWQDKLFSVKLGAVLTQDRLRAMQNSFFAAGEFDKANAVQNVYGLPGSPFKTRAEYDAALKDPEIQRAVELHKQNVQPLATAQHTATGGKIASSGPDTDAFINLIAEQGTGGLDRLLYGSTRGETTNPLKKGSIFSKQARGTAETYDFDYRNIAEKMVSGNYEQAALREMYDTYLDKKLAFEERPGVPPPVIRGKPAVKIPIEVRATPWGTITRKNLWVERTLAPELEQALATDKPVRSTLGTLAIGAINDMQIAGPTDATLHMGNMWAAIAGSQGGRNMMVDLARQVPGVRGLDTMARIAYNIKRVMMDTPEVQRELAEIAEIGAGRSDVVHVSNVGKLLTKVLPNDLVTKLNPSKLIKILDSAGRLSLNHMYDNLVKRGLTQDTPQGRREFVNQMGQYNARLRGKVDTLLREYGVSPFVVAGKNFNRLATQRLMLHPGFATSSPQAFAKTRLVNALGIVASVATFPLVVNCYTTGNPFGRKDKNIPLGAIDLGKDDSEGNAITFDLLHGSFLRRALRITGAQALKEGHDSQQVTKDTLGRAATQVLEGYLGPFTGPVPSFVYTAGTGKNLRTGQLVSENPNAMGQNVWAAFSQLNPSLAAAYKGWFESEGTDQSHATGIARQELGQIRRAVGVSTARPKSLGQQEREAGVDKLPLAERADSEASLKAQRKPLTDNRARLRMEEDFAARQRENVRQIENSLSRDNRLFVKSNQLVLPEYQEKLHLQKLPGQPSRDVTLMPREREEYRGIMTQEYSVALDELRSDSYFQSLPQDEKQKALGSMIAQAHRRAKNQYEQVLSQRAEGQ